MATRCHRRGKRIWTNTTRFATFALALWLVACQGCANDWYSQYRWKAEEFFEDPAAIALCAAISSGDVSRVAKALEVGDAINVVGKDGMTPLLWAYVRPNIPVFTELLEQGANPNVITQGNFGVRSWPSEQSVTHLCCDGSSARMFDLVFEHGGDPNLVCTQECLLTPLTIVIRRAKGEEGTRRLSKLVELGADVDCKEHLQQMSGNGPLMLTVLYDLYEDAAILVDAGADVSLAMPGIGLRPIHVLADANRKAMAPEKRKDYDRLAKMFEAKGQSLAAAREELEEWARQ